MRTETKRNKVKEIWMLIHGVESDARGMLKIEDAMYADSRFSFETCRVKVHKYYQFPFYLSVFEPFQKAYSDMIYFHIKALYNKYKYLKKVNIIAHSWGTFLLSEALKKYNNLKVEKVILLGSVIKVDFDWNIIRTQYRRVVNIIGKKDPIQFFARLSMAGMGMSGRKGFKREILRKVKNIETDWGHCGYADDENVQKIIEEAL